MLLNRAIGTSAARWLLVAAVGLALALASSAALADAADAAPLNKKERLLVNKKLWFEYDWDQDGVCYLYDFAKGTSTVGPHLRVVKTAYFVNPFTGQCRLTIPSTSYGGVGQVKDGALRIRWPSAAGGYVERVNILRHRPDLAALRISRPNIGKSWWQNCDSPQHPFC